MNTMELGLLFLIVLGKGAGNMKKVDRFFESTYIFVEGYDGDSWWGYSEFHVKREEELRIGRYAKWNLVNTEDWLSYSLIKKFGMHPWRVFWD